MTARRLPAHTGLRGLSIVLCLGLALAAAPAHAKEEPGGFGVGALLTFESAFNHGGNYGATLHLENHLDATSVRLSLTWLATKMYDQNDAASGGTRSIAGGQLLAVTTGVRQVLSRATMFQPWVAAGLGYGWFWFDEFERSLGAVGIDSHRLAWYGEAGLDVVDWFVGMTLSVRALSSPVGMLYMPSVAFFYSK